MMTPSTDVLKWVDDRIRSLLDRPGMWGDLRSLELLYLQLLEFRLALTTHPAKYRSAELELRAQWQKLIRKLGFISSTPLAPQLIDRYTLVDESEGALVEAMIIFLPDGVQYP